MWRLLAFFCLSLPAYCTLVNRTIDDAFPGDDTVTLTYFPQRSWQAASSCPGCHGLADPDSRQAYMGTWHDTTQDSNIDKEQAYLDISFTGNAISVYCIIANRLPPKVGTKADYSFFLDGVNTNKNYLHTTDNTATQFYYNVPVFSMNGLASAKHTLRVIPNGGAGIQGSTLLLFDYAIVGAESDTTVSEPNTSSPASTQGNPAAQIHATVATSGTSPSESQGGTHTTPAPGGHAESNTLSTFATDSLSPSATPTTLDTVVKPSGTKTATLTAGILSGLLGLIMVLVFLFFFVRKRRHRRLLEKSIPFDATVDLIPPPRNDHIARWVEQQDPFIHRGGGHNPYNPPPIDNISDIEASARPRTPPRKAEYDPSEYGAGSQGTSTTIRQLEREIAQLRIQQQELMMSRYGATYTQ